MMTGSKGKWKSNIVNVIVVMCLLYTIARLFLCLDFSQDYRKVPGIEDIVFQRNGWNEHYKRCFWGLRRVKAPETSPENLVKVNTSSLAIDELCKVIEKDTDYYLRQALFSPDEKYVLYCEIEYNYKHEGQVGDDEYCYYKVCELESGKVTTIYQAYREWYNLDWSDESQNGKKK